MNLDMKKPCANCPFLKVGAIELQPGRVEGICQDLIDHDQNTFQCHKTVHSKRGGTWEEEDESGDSVYVPSGNESACMGALVYLYKIRQPNVAMRLGFALGMLKPEELERLADKVIDPFPGHGQES